LRSGQKLPDPQFSASVAKQSSPIVPGRHPTPNRSPPTGPAETKSAPTVEASEEENSIEVDQICRCIAGHGAPRFPKVLLARGAGPSGVIVVA